MVVALLHFNYIGPMCYSTSNKNKNPSRMEKAFDAPIRVGYHPYYWMSGFAHGKINVLKQESPSEIGEAVWGICEPGTTDVALRWKDLGGKSLNTQAEYVFDNRRTADAIFERRCLIPVTGFFEPYKLKGKRYPHLVQPLHDDYLGLLGVYNTIDGVGYCSILTAEANAYMKVVHNDKKRQPILLDPYHWKDWLQADLNSDAISQLMFHADTQQELESYTVARPATNARAVNNVPEVLQFAEYPEVKAQQQYDISQLDRYHPNFDHLNARASTTGLF
jgi:putative SOS response-associated peptidase YedK